MCYHTTEFAIKIFPDFINPTFHVQNHRNNHIEAPSQAYSPIDTPTT